MLPSYTSSIVPLLSHLLVSRAINTMLHRSTFKKKKETFSGPYTEKTSCPPKSLLRPGSLALHLTSRFQYYLDCQRLRSLRPILVLSLHSWDSEAAFHSPARVSRQEWVGRLVMLLRPCNERLLNYPSWVDFCSEHLPQRGFSSKYPSRGHLFLDAEQRFWG